MNIRSSYLHYLLRFLLLLSIFSILGGCGFLLTPVARMSKFDNADATENKRDFADSFVQTVANDFGIMALFAQVAYREDLRAKGASENACAYMTAERDDRYGMPSSGENAGFWMRWKGAAACIDDRDTGLFYETYVFRNAAGQYEEAVIAFRGTENSEGQFLADWKANLSAVFGIEPAQYKLARTTVPELVDGLLSENPQIKLYTVGHSLGGGLAQQAGYQFKKVLKVITFNTSPVTNWTYLQLNSEVRNRYPVIYRIHHGGEVLENVRFITTAFTATRFNRYDLGLQFKEKALLSGHSMSIVTCTLAEIIENAKNGTGDAAHHYGREYVRQIVLAEGGMCGRSVAAK